MTAAMKCVINQRQKRKRIEGGGGGVWRKAWQACKSGSEKSVYVNVSIAWQRSKWLAAAISGVPA